MSLRGRGRRTAVWLALLGAPLSCAGPGQQQMAPLVTAPAVLLQMIPPAAAPLPPAFEEAKTLFARATDEYRAGHHAEAADGFMAAARALQGADADGDPWGAIGNRKICYQNATYAFAAAKDPGGGKRKLAAAAGADPTCAAEIDRLMRQLDAPAV